MRTTQYIGLNAAGLRFVKDLECVTHIRNTTEGMFMEEIPLGVWMSVGGHIIKEVVQVAPWSSGPMIFTCLDHENGRRYHEWKEDESMRGQEYDHEAGLYYV